MPDKTEEITKAAMPVNFDYDVFLESLNMLIGDLRDIVDPSHNVQMTIYNLEISRSWAINSKKEDD